MASAVAGLFAFIAGLFGLLAYFLSLALNSHFRSEAAKHPQSFSFWYVKTFDALLNNTFYRPLTRQPAKRPSTATGALGSTNERYVESLHRLVGTEEMIDVRQSLSVSIDLTTRLPRFLLNVVAQPATPVAAAGAAGLMLAVATSIVVWNVSTSSLATVIALYSCIPYGGILWFVFARRGSFMREMQKLYYRRYLVLNIDDKVVYSESGWGRFVFQLTPGFSFVLVANEFTLGIGVTISKEGDAVDILTYHRFLEHLIMDEDGLRVLCRRLNHLVAQVQALPKIKYDEIQM
jgi:hypothetical protein